MNCYRCTTPLPDSARFCFTCGADVSSETAARTQALEVDPELEATLSEDLRGDYIYGQLGIGATGNRSTPQAVSGGLTFASLTAHFAFCDTCGLTPSGSAYCWGSNGYGQVGDGSVSSRLAPVAVGGGLTFAAVSPGLYHTRALSADAAAYCWGYSANGRLGNNSTTALTAPTPVVAGVALTTVSAGHTCRRTTGGAVYRWGRNVEAQLGDGSTTQRNAPVAGLQRAEFHVRERRQHAQLCPDDDGGPVLLGPIRQRPTRQRLGGGQHGARAGSGRADVPKDHGLRGRGRAFE